MTVVSKDVVLLPEASHDHPDRWVAMNVFARTCIGVGGDVVRLLGNPALDGDDDGPFTCWEIEWFSNEEGLMADPSRYRRNPEDWRELKLNRNALTEHLRRHFILIDDEEAYRARFRAKRNALDWDRLGDFHQQHGQHLLLSRRVDPAAWWMQQKFTDDRRAVRPENLYGAVQAEFLKEFAARRARPGTDIVDLGCGTGIYSNLLAKHGATVLGIDPSDDYLAVARAHAVPGTRFENMKVGEPGGLDRVPSSSADIVFMSDALLFYFRRLYPGQRADIEALLSDILRILRPGGTFVSLEPHGAFYLAPWLGAVDRPFTIISEYANKSYGITPPIGWLLGALTSAGFAITGMQEVGPADYFADVDARAYHFAREFPLWHLFEMRKIGS